VRRDRERPLVLDGQYSWLEPCWDAHLGQPYLNGLRAMVAAEARPAVAVHIPLSYFSELARAASAPLIASGKLAKGDIVEFRVCAYPDERHELEDGWADELLSVRPEPQNIALDDRNMDDFLADSDACGRIDVDEMPVFIPRELLSDVAGLMLHAGASETGGILVGHLHRDRRRREIFLEVTAQVPAEHAQHELTRLTFTPDTWAAADAVLALRGRREIYVGCGTPIRQANGATSVRPKPRPSAGRPAMCPATSSASMTRPCTGPSSIARITWPSCFATVARQAQTPSGSSMGGIMAWCSPAAIMFSVRGPCP